MSNNVVSRVRNLQRAQAIHAEILEWLKGRDARQYLKEYLESFTAEELRILLTRVHVGFDRKSKAANVASLLECDCYNPILVSVEINWGRKWSDTEQYMKQTTGEGCHVQVMETRGRNFKGCPLGTGTTVAEAINDFVARATYEYTGPGHLSRGQIVIHSTKDYRTTEANNG